MPRVKGIYEHGIIRPVEKIDLPEKGEVVILFEKKAKEKKRKTLRRLPIVKAKELNPLVGFLSIGGDAVKDAERYDD